MGDALLLPSPQGCTLTQTQHEWPPSPHKEDDNGTEQYCLRYFSNNWRISFQHPTTEIDNYSKQTMENRQWAAILFQINETMGRKSWCTGHFHSECSLLNVMKDLPKLTVLSPAQKDPRDVTQCQTPAALVLSVAHKWCWTKYLGMQVLVLAYTWV